MYTDDLTFFNTSWSGFIFLWHQVKGQEIPPPVWRAYGNQGNVWILARLSIPTSAAKAGYQVMPAY